ncbi:MAG TPA: hypothetical protein VNZ50_13095 [Hyphomicrobiaceae bacterium]|nr:hypothetical protein [Hyphomicrobiaceae bacterium]
MAHERFRGPHGRGGIAAIAVHENERDRPLLQEPYRVEAGDLVIPDVPGVGLDWDEDAVAAHLVS